MHARVLKQNTIEAEETQKYPSIVTVKNFNGSSAKFTTRDSKLTDRSSWNDVKSALHRKSDINGIEHDGILRR